MKVKLLLIYLIVLSACVTSKKPGVEFAAPDYFILKPDIRLMEIDPLGNIHIVDASGLLAKYDTTGSLLHRVINLSLGEVHSIDVGNPFKVLVFYRDQQTVILYDRTLSEIQRIPLAAWGLHDVTAVCLSPDNAIWLFDGTNKLLVKMSDTGTPILNSDPFDVIAPASVRPDFIYDVDQLLLIKEKGKPISVFNDFGSYLRPLEYIDENFMVSNGMIIFPAEDKLRFYDISDQVFLEPLMLDNAIFGNRVHLFANRYYLLDDKGIYIGKPKK